MLIRLETLPIESVVFLLQATKGRGDLKEKRSLATLANGLEISISQFSKPLAIFSASTRYAKDADNLFYIIYINIHIDYRVFDFILKL